MEGNETVSVGSPVVALTDLGPQQCTADINETDIGRIALNQRVEITPNAFPDQRYTGRVIQISPRADRNKNTLEVKTVVEAGDRVLPYDLSVKISFQAQSRKSEPAREMKIPISALTERDGKRIVYVAIGSHASSRTVEIGDVRDGMVVITRGLSPGDRVIVSNPGALSEGQRLKL
jgi:HlyD family secretion protein